MNLISSPVKTTLQEFLDYLVPGDLPAGVSVPLWRRTAGRSTSPGFPVSSPGVLKPVDALFFGTSTMHADTDGAVRNRQSLFHDLRLIVLDDIGTKIPLDSLPAAMRDTASYIIESSPGNFQYGYVFDTPVTDLAAAKVLVQSVYRSGFTDSGGGLVNKAVRLPYGVNGKAGDGQDFQVKLHRCGDSEWTPQALLDAIGSDLVWTAVLEDAVEARKASRDIVASDWSPVRLTTGTGDGYVDPVLEWLSVTDRVISETDDWITIQCPWHEGHTQEGSHAGYSPIGRGDPAYADRRAFHCFHDHCSDQRIAEMLDWVVTEGGPEASVSDMAWQLLADWAFDTSNNAAQSLQNSRSIAMQAFRTFHPTKVRVPDAEKPGKTKKVAEVDIWVNAPNRLTLHGKTYDPEQPRRIVSTPEGPKLNTFKAPSWGARTAQYEKNKKVFLEFLQYLIPDSGECMYFVDWLAAKAQNHAFRGAGVVMTTPAFGVGRGTLGRMILELFNPVNVANMSFDKLVGTNHFNEWQEKLFLLCDETRDQGETSLYRAYERLKDLIDVHVKEVTVNPKYERTRAARCCTSFLLFSNHSDGVAIAEGDRRLYVITNAAVPAEPASFVQLNAWLDGNAWQADVWHYLLSVSPDMGRLLAPAPTTQAKFDMVEQGKSAEQRVCEFLIDNLKVQYPFMAGALIEPMLDQLAERLHEAPKRMRAQMKRLLRAATYCPPGEENRVRVHGKQVRVRAFTDGTEVWRRYEVEDIARSLEAFKPAELLSDAEEFISESIL